MSPPDEDVRDDSLDDSRSGFKVHYTARIGYPVSKKRPIPTCSPLQLCVGLHFDGVVIDPELYALAEQG